MTPKDRMLLRQSLENMKHYLAQVQCIVDRNSKDCEPGEGVTINFVSSVHGDAIAGVAPVGDG